MYSFSLLLVSSILCFIVCVVLKVKDLGLPDDLTAVWTSDWKVVNLFFSGLETRQVRQVAAVSDQGRDCDGVRRGERPPAEYADQLGQQLLLGQNG